MTWRSWVAVALWGVLLFGVALMASECGEARLPVEPGINEDGYVTERYPEASDWVIPSKREG